MKLRRLIKKMDHILERYLGFENVQAQPTSVKLKDGQLIVTNTAPYKRHMVKEPWETFILSRQLTHINLETRKKLGLAVGKALAKNLVISFEETLIKAEVKNVTEPDR